MAIMLEALKIGAVVFVVGYLIIGFIALVSRKPANYDEDDSAKPTQRWLVEDKW